MSSIEFRYIDEFNGTHGFVRTKGFVNWIVDLPCHQPRQKVMLGDSERGNVLLPCVVYAEDIVLEQGYGYRFGGIDFVYENGEQIQLYLGSGAWADEIYDPAES